MRLRSSLFLKIYLTVLGGLAALAVVSAFTFMLWQYHGNGEGWIGKRDRFIASMLPPDQDPATMRTTLERLARAADADISLFDHDGRMIAHAGRPLPDPGADGSHWGPGAFSVNLPDGRRLALRLDGGFERDARRPALYIVLVALVMGAAAWPVVRHLTRRLENLRHGAEAWGAGDLAARVNDTGSDEVAAVARSFNSAAAKIEDLLSAHRHLLAHASHELRSPLARLRMAVDLFEARPDDMTRQEIIQNLGELDTLVEEILLASRLDHQPRAMNRRDVDLLELTAGECARFGVGISGESAIVSGDAKLLRRLVANLLQNALKHGAPPVEACVERTGGKVRLSVTDHGPGLPPGEAERIFEPFYRPPGKPESAGGWGLGLSLVKRIATLHGATAAYVPGKEGVRFAVTFPGAGSTAKREI